MRVLAIAGSLRRGSYNRRLLDDAARLAPAGVLVEVWEGLRDLPHFDQDAEGESPAAVARLRDALRGADALLVATPEYNSSLPGVLKNALDWASRPPGSSALRGLPVAVVSASTSRFGGVWAAQEVRKVLGASGARVVDAQMALPQAHERFDEQGRLRSAELAARLRAVLDALAAEAAEEAAAA